MHERRLLGRSAVAVTRLGFGGGPLGNLGRALSEAEAEAVLAAAWDAGIRYFDTAPLYGHGRSEERLGRFLRGRPRDGFAISTKVGRLLVPAGDDAFERHGFVDTPPLRVVYDYSRAGTLRSLEASLRRLGLARVDIALVHDIDRRTHGAEQPRRLAEALDGALPTLLELRAHGVVGAVGLGVNEWQVCRDVLLRADLDCLLLAGRYTLLEQEPAEHLLALCREREVAVIVGGPFNSGILATGAGDAASYDYAPAPPAVRARVAAMARVLEAYGVALPAAALQFPLHDPAVACVLPGLMRPGEVRAALCGLAAPIPPAAWAALRTAGLLDPAARVPA